mgnify:CR=1 FL=1
MERRAVFNTQIKHNNALLRNIVNGINQAKPVKYGNQQLNCILSQKLNIMIVEIIRHVVDGITIVEKMIW